MGKGKQQPGQFYNLDSDPGEQTNVIKDNRQLADEMKQLLQKLSQSKAGIRKEAG